MRIRLILSAVLLLLLGGCGSAPTAVSPPGSAAGTPTAPAAGLDFRGSTLDGAAFDGAALAGKPVVLWFWAPY